MENTKITIKNLSGWAVSFKRLETLGDVYIPSNSIFRIDKTEVISQVYSSNPLFVGSGNGNHAAIYIDDDDTRVEVGFETKSKDKSESVKQTVLDEAALKNIFETSGITKFKEKIQSLVKTRAEKNKLVSYAQKNEINDYKKIKFIEEYTGYKFEKD